jgi:hypothetical protein
VAANALAEALGLGGTFAIAVFAFSRLGEGSGPARVLVAFALAVASGGVEATVVGLAQLWPMRPWFPPIRARAWWLATLAGALFAYALGCLPSTLIDLGEQAASAPIEPPQWEVLLPAAALGAVAGAVLSFAQWLALRRQVERAGLWIPANALAWAAGMPVIFRGIDVAQRARSAAMAIPLMAGVLFVTGAVVGATHGAFLVRLARLHRTP